MFWRKRNTITTLFGLTGTDGEPWENSERANSTNLPRETLQRNCEDRGGDKLERLNPASVSPSEDSNIVVPTPYQPFTSPQTTSQSGSNSGFLSPPAVLPADQLAKIAATAQHQLSSFHSFDQNPYLPSSQSAGTSATTPAIASSSTTPPAGSTTSAALTSMLSLSDPAQLNSLNMDLPSVLNQYNPYGNPYGSMYGKHQLTVNYWCRELSQPTLLFNAQVPNYAQSDQFSIKRANFKIQQKTNKQLQTHIITTWPLYGTGAVSPVWMCITDIQKWQRPTLPTFSVLSYRPTGAKTNPVPPHSRYFLIHTIF